LSARVADAGQARVELPIDYAGTEISITLDPRFVGDFLRVLDAEKQVTFDLRDSDSAAMLMTDDGYNYVIMPLARDK
jgi:DNA polymerase-3 subunit beta